MSKLAHSCDETMAIIEREAEDRPDPDPEAQSGGARKPPKKPPVLDPATAWPFPKDKRP